MSRSGLLRAFLSHSLSAARLARNFFPLVLRVTFRCLGLRRVLRQKKSNPGKVNLPLVSGSHRLNYTNALFSDAS
jgi:hypothetical protein